MDSLSSTPQHCLLGTREAAEKIMGMSGNGTEEGDEERPKDSTLLFEEC